MEQTRKPVYVNGLGAVTAYGWGRKHLWDGLLSGRSAARPEPGYQDVLGHDLAWVAHIEDGGDPEHGPSRFSRAFHSAAREAIDDALERGWEPGRTVGVVHAIVLGDMDLWRDMYLERGGELSRREYIQLMPSTPLSTLMQEHDFHGPVMTVSAMCASGNSGLLTAKMWLDAGMCTDVLFIATDLSGTPETIRHFRDLGVLVADASPREACRPFQEGSRGFMLGEASVGMVMSHAKPGAYVQVRGGAMSHDAHHVINIESSHREVLRCVNEALEDAGASPDEVAYLNAHGPGTAQCDAAEGRVLDELFPEASGVFSVKPLVGHCQGAAAAVELAVSCMSYEHGVIPAPPKVGAGHPRLLDGPTPRRAGATVKTSIGMGGHNSAVVLDAP